MATTRAEMARIAARGMGHAPRPPAPPVRAPSPAPTEPRFGHSLADVSVAAPTRVVPLQPLRGPLAPRGQGCRPEPGNDQCSNAAAHAHVELQALYGLDEALRRPFPAPTLHFALNLQYANGYVVRPTNRVRLLGEPVISVQAAGMQGSGTTGGTFGAQGALTLLQMDVFPWLKTNLAAGLAVADLARAPTPQGLFQAELEGTLMPEISVAVQGQVTTDVPTGHAVGTATLELRLHFAPPEPHEGRARTSARRL